MVSFYQILTDFNLYGLSEAARNDKVGNCCSTWHVGKILTCVCPVWGGGTIYPLVHYHLPSFARPCKTEWTPGFQTPFSCDKNIL